MRLARSAQDISRIVEMVVSLVDAVDGPQKVDFLHTGASVARLIQSESAVVFMTSGGFIAGEVCSTIINPMPVAVEHGWFASDRSGLRLLRAFEKWARSMGCEQIKMSSGISNGAQSILSRLGYTPVEKAWVK